MSFTSLKGFYVSNDLDTVLDRLTAEDEEICRIETCILMKELDASLFVPDQLSKLKATQQKHPQVKVKLKQRTYVHVILTTNGIVMTKMDSSMGNEGSSDSVVTIPWSLIKNMERRQTLVSRTEAFRLFGCTPKGREQMFLFTLHVSKSQKKSEGGQGCGNAMTRCFASSNSKRGKEEERDGFVPKAVASSVGSENDDLSPFGEPLESIELLAIEPDSHLFTTSSLIWMEKRIAKRALACYERHPKPPLPSYEGFHKHHHAHLHHELPQHEENTRFFHNLMTLLDSKRLINKADAVALKELVTTMYRVTLRDGIYFKRVVFSSSKAWPVITERLSTWLDFCSRCSPSTKREGEADYRESDKRMAARQAAYDTRHSVKDGPAKVVETLEEQVKRFQRRGLNQRMYSDKFRRLKEWPFAFTSKEALPYHSLKQKKWFGFVEKAANEHVKYKIRYLIHLIYYMVKDCAPIQERLYWMLEPTQGEAIEGLKSEQPSCFFDLFMLMCACMKLDFLGLNNEMESEITSILYYVMKFSEEAAESMDKDPLTFLARCVDSSSYSDLQLLLEKLVKPVMLLKNTHQLNYEMYQSLYLATNIIKLRPQLVHSMSQQFDVHFKYFIYHQLHEEKDHESPASFLTKLYTTECEKIMQMLKT